MEQQLFLGIDGGQTSTQAAICDQAGQLLGAGRAGPANHLHEPGGAERLQRALRDSLQAAWRQTGFDPAQRFPTFAVICCGMTGGGEPIPGLLGQYAAWGQLLADYDLATAHAGALLGAPGVIVIAGTGSAAYGTNSAGQTARAGGWAHLMGDEGSGYDLGRQALIAAARAEDGREPATCLLPAVLAFFEQDRLWQVRQLVYSPAVDRARIAQLAPLVFQAARQGDAAAQAILERAGQELAELGLAVLRRLGLQQQAVRVAPVGGLFQAGEGLRVPFARHLQSGAPQAEVVEPACPPVLGALLLALKAGGVAIDLPLRRRLQAAAQQLGSK
jgi:glucosamine kinase